MENEDYDPAQQAALINALHGVKSPWSVNLQAAPLLGPAIGHGMGGRIAYEHPLGDDSGLEFGLSGGYAQGRAGNNAISKGTLGGANLTYRNKGSHYGLEYANGMTHDGKPNRSVMATFRSEF